MNGIHEVEGSIPFGSTIYITFEKQAGMSHASKPVPPIFHLRGAQ